MANARTVRLPRADVERLLDAIWRWRDASETEDGATEQDEHAVTDAASALQELIWSD